MSHSVVIVTGDRDLDEQLAPFDEGREVPRYKERISLDDAGRAFSFIAEAAAEDVELAVARARDRLFRPSQESIDRAEAEVRAWKAKAALMAADLASPDPERQRLAQLAALAEYHGGECGQDDEGFFSWSTYNPQSRWDWYVVGGRWRGYFTLTEQAAARQRQGDPVLAVGVPGTFESIAISEGRAPFAEYSGKADVARKRDIDWKAMRRLAELEADRVYDAFEAAVGDLDLTAFVPWSAFVARVDAHELSIEAAREAYHAQPVRQALRATYKPQREADAGHVDLSWSDVENFLPGRAAFVKARGDACFVPFAILHEGEWMEAGRMGWFGVSRDDKDPAEWNSQVVRFLELLPEDTLLTAVDVHI